ncbi:MAG: hypothetical protein H6668_10400 [Ardenticatenaceae bacterium]|nr:hypothetical protein [Ardenticatenaceae bacterium]
MSDLLTAVILLRSVSSSANSSAPVAPHLGKRQPAAAQPLAAIGYYPASTASPVRRRLAYPAVWQHHPLSCTDLVGFAVLTASHAAALLSSAACCCGGCCAKPYFHLFGARPAWGSGRWYAHPSVCHPW